MGVTQNGKSESITSGQPRHVVMADDGSNEAARARAFAVMLAAATGAQLTVMYVREPTEGPEEADRKLVPIRAAAVAANVECRVVIEPPVGITNPGRRIVEAARREDADMIVLGARGTGLVHRMLGSVSSYVVSHAPMSVSVVR